MRRVISIVFCLECLFYWNVQCSSEEEGRGGTKEDHQTTFDETPLNNVSEIEPECADVSEALNSQLRPEDLEDWEPIRGFQPINEYDDFIDQGSPVLHNHQTSQNTPQNGPNANQCAHSSQKPLHLGKLADPLKPKPNSLPTPVTASSSIFELTPAHTPVISEKELEIRQRIKEKKHLFDRIDRLDELIEEMMIEYKWSSDELERLEDELNGCHYQWSKHREEQNLMNHQITECQNDSVRELANERVKEEDLLEKSQSGANEMRSQLERSEELINGLSEEKEKMSRELSDHKDRIRSKDAVIQQLEQHLRSVRNENEQLRSDLKSSDDQRARMNESQMKLNQNIQDMREQSRVIVAEKDGLIRQLRSQMGKNEQQRDQLKDEIIQLSSELAAKDDRIQELEQGLRLMDQERHSVMADLSAKDKRVSELELKNDDPSERLRSSEKRNDELTAALVTLKDDNEWMEMEKDQEILELRIELSELNVQMDQEKGANDQLVARLRDEISKLKRGVAERDDQIAHYEHLSLKLMNQQTNGIHNAEEHAREVQEQRDEINRLRDALSNLRSEKEDSDQQRLKLEDENERLRNVFAESKRERLMSNEQDTRQRINGEESEERVRLMDEHGRMQLDEINQLREQLSEKNELILGLQREMTSLKSANENSLLRSKEMDDRGSIEMEESDNRLKMVEDMAKQVLSERDDLVRELANERQGKEVQMKEINLMQYQLEKSQSEENELRSQLEASMEEINGLSEENERMRRELSHHSDQIRDKDAAIQGLEDHLRSMRNENEQLRSDLKSADDQRARMSESQMESEQNILDLTQRIAELERGRDQSTVMLADKDGLIRQLRSQMDENEQLREQLKDEITDLKTKMTAKDDRIQELEQSLRLMDQERHSVMADLSAKNERVSELELKNEDLSERLRSSEKRNDELTAALVTLKGDTEWMEMEKDQEILELRDHLNELVVRMDQERSGYDQSVDRLRDEIEEEKQRGLLEMDEQRGRQIIGDAECESRVRLLQDQRAKLEDENGGLKNDLSEHRDQIRGLEDTIIQLSNELAAKDAETEQLEEQAEDQVQLLDQKKPERENVNLNSQLIQDWQTQLDAALKIVSELEREKQAAEEAVQCELMESEQRCEQIKREKKEEIHAIHDRLAEQTGIVAELQSRLATVESEKAIRRDQCAQSDGCSSLMQQHYEQSVLRKDEESEQAISERDRTVDALKQRLVDSEAERQERYSRLMREYNARVRSIDHYRVGTIALCSCNLLFIGVISVLLVRHRMHLRNHQMFRNQVLDLLHS